MNKPIFTDPKGNIIEKPENEPVTWRISAYAYVRKDNTVLMVRDSLSGTWELPGGGIELTESIGEGLARECYEESGYKVQLIGAPLQGTDQYFYNPARKTFHHAVALVYAAELLSPKQNTDAINSSDMPDEIEEVAWQKVSDLPQLNIHRMFKAFLDSINK